MTNIWGIVLNICFKKIMLIFVTRYMVTKYIYKIQSVSHPLEQNSSAL